MKTITTIYVFSPTCLWLWFLSAIIVLYTRVDDSTSVEKNAQH